MTNVLINEIEPQMKRLREERDNYFLWKSGENELQKTSKILTACEYYVMRKENGEKTLDLSDTKRNKDEI
jgi:chromosome segregation ATPase